MEYSRTNINVNKHNKSWWSKRSNLERTLVVLLILIIVISSGCAGYFMINRTTEKSKICDTSHCLLTASQLVHQLDQNIDPCEDFYKFACQKFKTTEASKISDLMKRQLKDIIEEPIRMDDYILVRSQKMLFQTCMNKTLAEEESLDIFKKTLEDLQGWPVVKGYLWKARRFDWKDMIYELRNKGYYSKMMMSVDLSIDPDNLNERIFRVTIPSAQLILKQHEELYKQYMVEVAVFFGADENLAKNEMAEVYDFMEKIRQILYLPEINSNNSNDDYLNTAKHRKFRIDDYQERYDEIDWFEFINAIVEPLANVSGDTYVIFPFSEHLKAFFKLLRNTSKRTQANYIIWRLIENIIPYMPDELQQFNSNYTCSIGKPSKISRIDFCQNVVESSFPSTITDILYARKYLSIAKKQKVNELVESIKLSCVAELMKFEDGKNRSLAENIDSIDVIIGFEEDYFNDTLFEKFTTISDLNEIVGENFFSTILKSRKIVIDTFYSLIKFPTNFSVPYEFLRKDAPVYLEEFNQLIIRAGLLQGVHYNENRPMYFNYGTLGSQISQALAYGFFEYYDQTACLYRQQQNAGINSSHIEGSTIDLLKQIGVKISYDAYLKWLEGNEDEPELPGVPFTPLQLFWIASILPECYKLHEGENVYKATGPMRNNVHFADDFRCPIDAAMNPSEKCEL